MNTCSNPHFDFPLRIPTTDTSPPPPLPPSPQPLIPTTTPITLTTSTSTTFQHADDVVSVLPTNYNYASSSSCTCFNQQQQQQNHPRKKRSKLIMRPDVSPAKRPKPAKKPDPSAPKITKPCSECGRKFWSWKALFGHMRCHPERQWRGIDPPIDFRRPVLPDRVPNFSMGEDDDHEAASSLLMLASGADHQVAVAGTSSHRENDVMVECRFECSSCKKVFGSHQALGGHRASHKNVKGCFAITKSDVDIIIDHQEEDQHNRNSHISTSSRAMFPSEDDGFEEITEDNNKTMVHQCSICFRVFSSGQALGGHKRCHWEKGDDSSSSSSLLNMTQLGLNSSNATTSAGLESAGPHLLGGLDLNLPAGAGTSACTANHVGHDQSSSYSSSSGHNLDLRLGL